MAIPVLLAAVGIFVLRVVTSPAGRIIVREGIRRIPQAPIPKAPPRPPILGPKTQQPKTATAPAPTPVTPPVPLPTPQPSKGNTRPVGHDGKEDDKKIDCKKELEKYPVHAHKDKGKPPNNPVDHQSHHVMQNALFVDDKNNLPASLAPPICDSYTKDNAPCIPLLGGTKQPGTPHAIVSALQATQSASIRRRDTPYTYGDARKDAAIQLKAGKLSEKEIVCVMAAIDAKIKLLCPNITDSTVMRVPGLRVKP